MVLFSLLISLANSVLEITFLQTNNSENEFYFGLGFACFKVMC